MSIPGSPSTPHYPTPVTHSPRVLASQLPTPRVPGPRSRKVFPPHYWHRRSREPINGKGGRPSLFTDKPTLSSLLKRGRTRARIECVSKNNSVKLSKQRSCRIIVKGTRAGIPQTPRWHAPRAALGTHHQAPITPAPATPVFHTPWHAQLPLTPYIRTSTRHIVPRPTKQAARHTKWTDSKAKR